MTLSRRHVLTTGATVAAIGTLNAAGLASGVSSAEAACATDLSAAGPSTEHILTTQLSVATSVYNPPLTPTVETHSIHVEIVVLGGITVDGRVLQAATIDGTIVRGCTGPITNPNQNGVLTWADGSNSAFHVDSLSGTATSGHSAAVTQGHIVSGPYAGAIIKFIGSRRANNITACLTGSTVNSSTGYSVIVIEN
jgi:hypothetical protein